MSPVGQMFRLFQGEYSDLFLVALAIACIWWGIWWSRKDRYLGR